MAAAAGVEAFLAHVGARATAERAAKERGYLKSSKRHLGAAFAVIDAGLRETLAQTPADDWLALADALWATGVFEAMIAAGRTLRRKPIMAGEAAWRRADAWLDDCDSWALADNLAKAGGQCLTARPERLDRVEAWTRSAHLWRRRASLVYALPFAKPGRDPTRPLGFADRLADDPEWFIHKAIGWFLRTLAPHDPERVRAFLARHRGALRAVAVREATRRLPQP